MQQAREFRLADVCPRLALARDQWIRKQVEIRKQRQRHIGTRLRLERLVAHREMQFARIPPGRNSWRTYRRERTDKLYEARITLARFEARVARFEREAALG